MNTVGLIGTSFFAGIIGGLTVMGLSSLKNQNETPKKSMPASTPNSIPTSHITTPPVVLMSPNPDEKALQKYKREGFNDIVMKNSREYSKCYQDFLAKLPLQDKSTNSDKPDGPLREGVMTFVFNLKENGALINFELIRDDFNAESFVSCISQYFTGLHFLPPPLGINRFIAHDFSFKTEETYKRELEERKNQALPKVLPVGPETEGQ